jgi:hypothetical protein
MSRIDRTQAQLDEFFLSSPSAKGTFKNYSKRASIGVPTRAATSIGLVG